MEWPFIPLLPPTVGSTGYRLSPPPVATASPAMSLAIIGTYCPHTFLCLLSFLLAGKRQDEDPHPSQGSAE